MAISLPNTKSDAASLTADIIYGWVAPGASVLDLGCGDGQLLQRLATEKQSRVQGIEIDEQAVYQCFARGVSVLHGDIDTGLPDYADGNFDYVILNESFQQVRKPETVLREALRVGRQVIVAFPNFAHYSARLQIFFGGKTPVTPSLPYEWHDTPNIHFLSISDFERFCSRRGIRIQQAAFTAGEKRVRYLRNLRALTGIFLISRNPDQVRS